MRQPGVWSCLCAGTAGASTAAAGWLLLTGAFGPAAIAALSAAMLAVATVRDRSLRQATAQPARTASTERLSVIDHANAEDRIDDRGGAAAMVVDNAMVDRIHVADRVAWLSAIADLRSGVAERAHIEVRVRTQPEHAAVFDQMLATLSRTQAGVVVDFTQPHAAEASAANTAGQVDRSDAAEPSFIAAANQAMAAVSHEFRTPLNAIIGFADLLRGDTGASVPACRQREYADMIHEAGNHLLGIVNAVLDVAKLEAGRYAIRREAFDIKATIGQAVSMVQLRAAKKGLHVNLHAERAGALVQADRRATRQVLLNLLSNAIKFTPDNGCITIEATSDESGLVLTVADTGIGMSADDLARVGRPFEQIDNAYTRLAEGTGLGLSLTRGLIDLHGGTMEIESRRQVGTKVTVRIPRPEIGSACDTGKGAPIVAMDQFRKRQLPGQDKGEADVARRFG